MTNISIKIPKSLQNLDGGIIDEVLQIALVNASEEAIERAGEKAPYLTGTLRKSIAKEPMIITGKTRKVTVGPRKVAYAQLREYENFKNPDRKFYMKRTFQELPNFIEKELEKATEIVLKKNGLK